MKWITSIYLREEDWWEYKTPIDASWYWKRIVVVKDLFKEKMELDKSMLFEETQQPKVRNIRVWNRLNVPKHRLILWLAILNKMRTKERLKRITVVLDSLCLICWTAEEDVQHLFFRCKYSDEYFRRLKLWTMMQCDKNELLGILMWIKKKKKISKFRRNVLFVVLSACVYHIWKVRNEAFWSHKVWSVDTTVQNIKRQICNRVYGVMPSKLTREDRVWFERLCI